MCEPTQLIKRQAELRRMARGRIRQSPKPLLAAGVPSPCCKPRMSGSRQLQALDEIIGDGRLVA